MKNILVIAESSDKTQLALEKAMLFAKHSGAKIHVAINYYEDSTWQDTTSLELKKKQVLAEEENWWRNHIESINSDVVVAHQVLWEKYLVDWILSQCKAQTYDMIIKEGHRTESLTHTSTDWLLLRESTVPVYIVTPIRNRESNVVLVSLDLLAKSKEKQNLNARLLEEGSRLAATTNSVLHVCYVVKVLPALRDLDLVDPNEALNKAKPLAMEKFASIAADYDIDDANVHILCGDPNKVVCSLANGLKANCIVIGSMGRKGIVGKFFGNTSEQVVKLAHKDLLVLAPQ